MLCIDKDVYCAWIFLKGGGCRDTRSSFTLCPQELPRDVALMIRQTTLQTDISFFFFLAPHFKITNSTSFRAYSNEMGEQVTQTDQYSDLQAENQFFPASLAPIGMAASVGPDATSTALGPHQQPLHSPLSAPISADGRNAVLWGSEPTRTGFRAVRTPDVEVVEPALMLPLSEETPGPLEEAMDNQPPDVSYLSEIYHDSEDEHDHEDEPNQSDLLSCSGGHPNA